MAVLSKGTDFGATEKVTSGKLDNLVDAATFVSGGSGTCETGGGLNLSSNGRLQIEDGEIDLVKLSTNNALNSGLYGVLDKVYPIGSIYQSTSQSTSPDNLFFGGTGLTNWTAVGEGRVLVAKASSGIFDTAGDTGGDEAKSKTIAVNELPKHKHRTPLRNSGMSNNFGIVSSPTITSFIESQESSTQSPLTDDEIYNSSDSQQTQQAMSLNVVQPYEVVYMWKRTA